VTVNFWSSRVNRALRRCLQITIPRFADPLGTVEPSRWKLAEAVSPGSKKLHLQLCLGDEDRLIGYFEQFSF